MMAHVSKPKSDDFFRSNSIFRTISWDFMLKQVFHVLKKICPSKMVDSDGYWKFDPCVCDGLCFCQSLSHEHRCLWLSGILPDIM